MLHSNPKILVGGRLVGGWMGWNRWMCDLCACVIHSIIAGVTRGSQFSTSFVQNHSEKRGAGWEIWREIWNKGWKNPCTGKYSRKSFFFLYGKFMRSFPGWKEEAADFLWRAQDESKKKEGNQQKKLHGKNLLRKNFSIGENVWENFDLCGMCFSSPSPFCFPYLSSIAKKKTSEKSKNLRKIHHPQGSETNPSNSSLLWLSNMHESPWESGGVL